MSPVVLDASVAAKWFLPPRDEALVGQALDLLRSYERGMIEFIAPDIFWVEFGSLSWKAVRRQRWSEAEAFAAIRAIGKLEISTFDTKPLLEGAFTIAAGFGTSIYDALYVALAHDADSRLITADEKLVNTIGSRFPVRWLGSFSIT